MEISLSLVHMLKISLENSVRRCLTLWCMQRSHHSFQGRFPNPYKHLWKETMKITQGKKMAEYTKRNECCWKWTKSVKICQEIELVQLRGILWNKIISVARLRPQHIFNIFMAFLTCVRGFKNGIGLARLSTQCERAVTQPSLAQSWVFQSGSAQLAECKAHLSEKVNFS